MKKTFPHFAPDAHYGPCGNQLVAQLMLDILTGLTEGKLHTVKTFDLDEHTLEKPMIKNRKLFEYDEIGIEINGEILGQFVEMRGELPQRPLLKWKMLKNFKEAKIASLLTIKDKQESIIDSVYIPVDIELKECAELAMLIKIGPEVKKYFLGRVELVNPRLNVGKVEFEKNSFNFDSITFHFVTDNYPTRGYIFSKNKVKEINILLNDRIILQSSFEKIGSDEIEIYKSMEQRRRFCRRVQFFPITGNFLVIKANPEGIVDVSELDKAGIIYLCLGTRQEDRGKIRVPFARWEKMIKTISLGERRIQEPIKTYLREE